MPIKLVNYIPNKALISKIYKEVSQINSKDSKQPGFFKWQKSSRDFSKEDIFMRMNKSRDLMCTIMVVANSVQYTGNLLKENFRCSHDTQNSRNYCSGQKVSLLF